MKMSLEEFKKEHKRLVRVLRDGTSAEREKEAASQQEEIADPKGPAVAISAVTAHKAAEKKVPALEKFMRKHGKK